MEISTAPAAKLVYQLSIYSFSSIFQSPIAIVYWSELARQITLAKMKSSHKRRQHGIDDNRFAKRQCDPTENLPSRTSIQKRRLIHRNRDGIKESFRDLESKPRAS